MTFIKSLKPLVLVAASLVAIVLPGCESKEEKSVSVAAAGGKVQGTSFDEPLTSTQPVKTEVVDAGTSKTAGFSGETPEKAAALTRAGAAVGLPADISKIPSATPVPQPIAVSSVAGGNPAPQPAASVNAAEFPAISFQTLAGFKYVEPIPKEGAKPEETEATRKKNQIPEAVLALNGKKALIEGYMVPMEVDDDGGVKSFVLVKTQPQCCFGDTQAMNEWVDVKMSGGSKAEFNVDRPIKVYGDLEVGEKMEDGFVLSIYRMTARKVDN